MNKPNKGLGKIAECESIYEASQRAEDEWSMSRPNLRRQSSSKLPAESRLAKASIFKPQVVIEQPSKNGQVEDIESSDSGIPEYTDNNRVSSNELLPQAQQSGLNMISQNSKKLVRLPSINSFMIIPQSRPIKSNTALFKSRDDLTKGTQRRSVTIERDVGSLL